MRLPNNSLLLMLAVVSLPGMVWAAPGDTVQPYVSGTIMYDNNLFRISSSVDPVTVTGQPFESDIMRQATAGVKVDWRQSRQEVLLDVSFNRTRFARFTTLDYQATDIHTRWNWQTGDRLNGDVGYNRDTYLGSYTEIQAYANNLSTQQNEFFDAAWQLKPAMRLNGSIIHSVYDVPANSVYGNDSMTYTAAANYTPPSGNEIGIKGSHQVQSYPVLQYYPGGLVDNGFTQNQLLATVNWLYSGHIRINGQAGMEERNHNQYPERDFRGNTMHGTLTWYASGKSQIAFNAWNEIDPYENETTSYTISKGISLVSTWNPTGKLGVSLLLQHLNRTFLGNPELVLYPLPPREDIVNTANITVNYQPAPSFNISASIQTEQRRSNPYELYAYYGYYDSSASLTMSYQF